jgi:hypothetical protein
LLRLKGLFKLLTFSSRFLVISFQITKLAHITDILNLKYALAAVYTDIVASLFEFQEFTAEMDPTADVSVLVSFV